MMRLVTMMLVVIVGACGPDIEPKRHNACAQAERADDLNERLNTPDGGCHVCEDEPLSYTPGGSDGRKYSCDCEVDDCGYWAPHEGSVEWTSAGSIKYHDDHDAACKGIPVFADDLTCTP